MKYCGRMFRRCKNKGDKTEERYSFNIRCQTPTSKLLLKGATGKVQLLVLLQV